MLLYTAALKPSTTIGTLSGNLYGNAARVDTRTKPGLAHHHAVRL